MGTFRLGRKLGVIATIAVTLVLAPDQSFAQSEPPKGGGNNFSQRRVGSVEKETPFVDPTPAPTPTPTRPPACPSENIFDPVTNRCERCDIYEVTTRFWQTSSGSILDLDPNDTNDSLLRNPDIDGPFLDWFETSILNPAVNFLNVVRTWLGNSHYGDPGGGKAACDAAGFDRFVRPADGTVTDFCARWNVWWHLDIGYHVHWIMNFFLRGYTQPGTPFRVPAGGGWVGHDGFHHTASAPAADWERNLLRQRNGVDVSGIVFDESIQYCFRPPVGGSAPVYVNCTTVGHSQRRCPAGASLAMASPISLIWEDHDFENTDATPARFSLDPRIPEGWSAWRASGKAPLLVVLRDDNKVTTSMQLFGNWTFGGRYVGHPTSVLSTEKWSVGKPWDNGFEALGSLDDDSDGVLRGKELARLGLWFDHNRDGVSDEKEVESLTSAGVNLLRFTGASRRPNGDLLLKLGYERVTPGGVKRGDLVDWYSPLASDVKTLVQSLSSSPKSEKRMAHYADPKAFAAQSQLGDQYLGAWRYSIEGTKGPSGILLITDAANGKLSGFSVATGRAVGGEGSDPLVRQLTTHQFTGQLENDRGDAYLVIDSEFGGSLITRISLPQGRTLSGKTHVTYLSDAWRQNLTYQWTATRLAASDAIAEASIAVRTARTKTLK